MVFYMEMGVRFTLEYGDIDELFYYSMESMYDSAAKHISEYKIEDEFLARMKKILSDRQGIGWGFYDTLEEIYQQHFQKKLAE